MVPLPEASLSYASTRIGASARAALGALGDEIRRAGPDGWCRPMMVGQPVAAEVFTAQVSASALDALVDAGLAAVAGGMARLAVTIVEVGAVLAVIPKYPWGDEVVYVGPDSAHLIEAVLRLAPRGERAADLGTGTGLLAALLGGRYRTVLGTDLAPSVVGAADLTFALNRRPPGHAIAACLTNVAAGLRPGAFDLVASNAPWVPLDASSEAPRELFAHGGDIGTELPHRFIRESAALLRPGGVAITLALAVELVDGRRPLDGIVAELTDAGLVVAVLPTPFNRETPTLVDTMRRRQPLLHHATHVAVVAARPRARGDDRASLLVAVDALRRRWARP